MRNIKELLVYKILRTVYNWFLQPFRNLAHRIRTVTSDHFWEKRIGIKTVNSSFVQNDTTMFKDNGGYAPTPYRVIDRYNETI